MKPYTLSSSADTHPYLLTPINGIKFTSRELDVIACLLSGRSSKIIGELLSIEEKTVETHKYNIMRKLECNSKDNIRKFIEKSGQFLMIKNHYVNLLIENLFKETLKDIVTLKVKETPSNIILYNDEQLYKIASFDRMERYLKLAGFKILYQSSRNENSWRSFIHKDKADADDCIIFPLSKEFLTHLQADENQAKLILTQLVQRAQQDLKSVILLLDVQSQSVELPQEITALNFINCGEMNHACLLVVEIIKRLLVDSEINRIIATFEREYQKIIGSFEHLPSQLGPEIKDLPPTRENTSLSSFMTICSKKFWLAFSTLLSLGVISIVGLTISNNKSSRILFPPKLQEFQYVRSDLPLPVENIFLERSKLIAEIEEKLRGQKGVQTLAIVGIGGAGKTMLARQYARTQNLPVVWEINAETKQSLISSFERLAYALAQPKEEKKILSELKYIKNFEEHEEKLIQFVKAYLKNYSDWLLVYDNVEKFDNIKKYFPSDPNIWGKGKAIVTTQDNHIQHNNYIRSTIQIGELNQEEKFKLFGKIMGDSYLSSRQNLSKINSNQQSKEFLNNIPPFPLDVATAAYYLKATDIPYKEYLMRLNQSDREFLKIQENILNELTNYPKTRYKIVTLSIKDLNNKEKDFIDLLLMVSLLDSRNIPRDLLEKYKGGVTVDNFVYYLKKYSLTTSSSLKVTNSKLHLFIHPSIQRISLAYLKSVLKLQKDSYLLRKIIFILDDYIDQALEQEDLEKIKIMAGHLEKLLTQNDILTEYSQGLLANKLGCIYYFLNNKKALTLIEGGLRNLLINNVNDLSTEEKYRIARSYLHIGIIYTELRLYQEAQILIEDSAKIYGEKGLNNKQELAWALSQLGNLYRRIGQYEKAKDCLEKSLHLAQQYKPDYKRLVRTLSCLGSVYRGLGLYQQSIKVLEESLDLCKKYYPHDHYRVGRILRSLGNVYRRIGDYKQAQQYLESSLDIFKKNFPENHINIGLSLSYLGNCLRQIGDYEKARFYLEESLKIHQKYYNENHPRIGWVLFYLATTYQALGKSHESHKLFDKILKIYDKKNNEESIETASLQRNIAEIYLEKNCLDKAEAFIKRSLNTLIKYNHVECYKAFEVLGEIYFRKSIQSSSINHIQESQVFKNQALTHFKKALQIAKEHLPEQSAHIQRISFKLKNLQEGELIKGSKF